MSCSTDSQGTPDLPEGDSAAAGDQQAEDLKANSKGELEISASDAANLQEVKKEHLNEMEKGVSCEATGLPSHPPFILKRDDGVSDYKLQSAEQDADDEAADDTDDTSSVTSSASSTASSQSGSGTGRKKSIPLSIKNLKRKHKKKKTKVSRVFKPGDRSSEDRNTLLNAALQFQKHLESCGVLCGFLAARGLAHIEVAFPVPSTVVVKAQSSQDPGMYGVVQSGDHIGRTCVVKWFKLKPSGDDVELVGEEEDVSVYDIADHPDFRFRTTDFVIRIGNAEDGASVGVNEVARVDFSSKVEVVWADNSRTIVLPQHLYNIESEIDEETDLDSIDGSTSGASSDEWEDESDSWETDNGLMEDDHVKTEEVEPEEPLVEEIKKVEEQVQGAVAMAVADLTTDKSSKEGTPKGFRELKEAIKILESLKNMTVEQLLTGYPTSPTVEPEKPTREKKFLDDIKKLQENLKKTLDNVAIVEEEKMEAMAEAEKKEEREAQTQTPVASEWPSETPVLCQQSGGKPGVTFTSAKGEVFSVLEFAPDSHAFKKMEFQPPEAKKFFSTVRKEMALLATSLPDGIMVKTFEDRMDLFSALVKGPTRTPYEDGLFLFDIQLPNIYPAVPPLFRYLSQCSGRLNPNLYDNGKVCVSLLGTWIGKWEWVMNQNCSGGSSPKITPLPPPPALRYKQKQVDGFKRHTVKELLLVFRFMRINGNQGTERWTSKSSLLQVLISIQGLILVNEPYYNEAGFDSDRGLQEGYENSRCYNEMALIRVVQSMMQLLRKPVEVFEQEIFEHFCCNGWRLVHRIESWVETNELVERNHDHAALGESSFVHPTCGILAESPVESMMPLGDQELGAAAAAATTSQLFDGKEELEDSGCGMSTLATSDVHQYSDSESLGQARAAHFARDLMDEGKAIQDSATQPSVKPKKRRKSYRSFLPERSGYPDIGFPLFPLSKGFIKSIRGVLQQYRAALIEANIPEWTEDK
ncbi:hypothetical protein JD844_011637 [Phrynosoma platyrhinos]|uniref:UBC core domain-containing protein n=1 Tax=Phrynosoma platyrhinos TaxID=52577 RepID=A0ABQ7TJ70_PHRPL|nr:hypothetical protein JD844_011637 [Phrynosoma platyrhinos]